MNQKDNMDRIFSSCDQKPEGKGIAPKLNMRLPKIGLSLGTKRTIEENKRLIKKLEQIEERPRFFGIGIFIK